MKSLRELKEGEKGVITRVRGHGEFRKRITEMGFVSGKWVIVIRSAPLQDPVEYRVMDSNISLRRSEAGLIEVMPEDEAKSILDRKKFNGVTTEEYLRKSIREKARTIHVALVGNPNSGKTTLFNHASRSREHVGNYAGVTVDSKTAIFKVRDYTIRITDLPGTYSLTEYSPEELFVRDHLFNEAPDIVINVVDASNLERNLFLTTQLIDMEVRTIVALNMFDELVVRGDAFDHKSLGRMIGMPFVPTIASKGKGVRELFDKVIELYEDGEFSHRMVRINYGQDLEESITVVRDELKRADGLDASVPTRFYALKLLEKDHTIHAALGRLKNYPALKEKADLEVKKLESTFGEDSGTLVVNAKYGFIEGALHETFRPGERTQRSFSQRLDSLLTGRILGYPIFILIMWLMFETTFLLGDVPVRGIEKLVDFSGRMLGNFLPDGMARDLIVDGIIGGVGGVIVFLPNILILFFFISLMEDTGYMARVAFIVDKVMHKVGLHGKSFIPLLMGFGCNVPAIMATRTIENRGDRLVTMLITPFMSCSARYPVYILLISAFFTSFRGTILFALYLFGILLAGLMALLFKKTLFKAKEFPFVMELPPYRIPTAKSVARHTWFKGVQYLRKMGTVILVASIVIWALGYFPRNQETIDSFDLKAKETAAFFEMKAGRSAADRPSMDPSLVKQRDEAVARIEAEKMRELQERSFIGRLGRFIEPVIQPLGFDWRMGVSLIAGSAAKEVVISTMAVLYQGTEGSTGPAGLTERLVSRRYDEGPLEGQPVFTPLVAFSFMIFVLIYFPCIAVIAAVRKESGRWKWAAFLAGYTTILAWICSFLFYQAGSLLL